MPRPRTMRGRYGPQCGTASGLSPPGGPHAAGVSGTVGACHVPMRGKRVRQTSVPSVCRSRIWSTAPGTKLVSCHPRFVILSSPGNSRIALPLFGEFVSHGRESLTTSRPTTSTLWRERGPPRMCALRHALDSTRRVEAMGGQSTQVSQCGTTGRPGQTDSAAHARWARQAQPSVRQPAVRLPGPPPICVSRLQALLRYHAVPQGARPPTCWLPCPSPLPRTCTTHW